MELFSNKNPCRIFQAQVLSSEMIAEGVLKISLKILQSFSFSPGQYVWVELPSMTEPDPRGSRRAFSILNSSSAENVIEIVMRQGDSGYKHSLFALKAGDPVIVHGPFGNSFDVNKQPPDPILMIAGGIGIVAFLSKIEALQRVSPSQKCYLLYLNSNVESTPFLHELEMMKQRSNAFDYSVKYSHFEWSDVAQKFSLLGLNTRWWITGPQDMVDFVSSILLANSVNRSQMEFENYYPRKENILTLERVQKEFWNNSILSQAIQNTTNHVAITDANGVVLFVNHAAEKMTGYSSDEILGNTPRLWGGLMEPEFYKNLWKKKLLGEVYEGEITNRRKNGELYHAIAHISPIFDEKKSVIGFIATEEDVTYRVRAEEKSKQSQRFLDSIVENLPTMLFVKDAKELKFVLFNKAGEELTGFKKEELVGKNDHDFFPKEQADAFTAKDREVLAKKVLLDIPEEPIDTKGKGKRVLHTRKIPILDTNGDPQYLLGVSEDITVLKQGEEKMRLQNEELERFNKLMVGRELRMVELKEEIEKLKQEVQKP